MKKGPKVGDKASWSSSGDEAHAKVARKAIRPNKIMSHKVAAFEDGS